MKGGNNEQGKIDEKNLRKESMQRKIYKYDRKRRETIHTQIEDMYQTLVGRIRFVVFLTIIREISVGGKMGIWLHQKI